MKRKNILVIFIASIILMVSSDYALAATGISEGEELILERLKAGVVVNDTIVSVPVSYINQAENEFIKNEIDITKEQAMVVINKIEEALKIVNTSNVESMIEMKNTDAVLELLKLVDEAATVINYKISVNLADLSIDITDPEGDTVFIARNSINQTGFRMEPIFFVGFLYLLTVFISLIVVVKMISFTTNFKNQLSNVEINEGLGSDHEA